MEIKEALIELNMYRKAKKRMSYIKERVAELQERMYSLCGVSEISVQGGQGKDEKVISLLDKIAKYRGELLDSETYSLCLQNDIERKIYKLREPYCSVLRGYYVEEKSYERLAVEMHYTFESIKQIKRRAVIEYSKLPQLYNENIYSNI